MKAIGLLICLLLPHAIVGSIYNLIEPQDNSMVNQRPLDFIDQYPISGETIKTLASAEDRKSKNEDPAKKKSTQETIDEDKNISTKDNKIQNQDQHQSSESQFQEAQMAVSKEAYNVKHDSNELHRQSSEESPKYEYRSSESLNTEVNADKDHVLSPKPILPMSQYKQIQRVKTLRPIFYTEEQPRQKNMKMYKSQTSGNKKSERQKYQVKYTEAQESKKITERQPSDMKSSNEQLQYQETQFRPLNQMPGRLPQEFITYEPQYTQYQSFESQLPEERNFEYQQPEERSSKGSKAQKYQNKKSKSGKKYNQKQIKVKPSEKYDMSQSEESLTVQRPGPENYKSYNTDYRKPTVMHYQPEEVQFNYEQPRSTYMPSANVYASRQYPVIQEYLRNEPEYTTSWMQNFLRGSFMKPMVTKTEDWKQFFIPATTADSNAAQENKARFIDIIFEAWKEQQKTEGLPNATELIQQVFPEKTEEHIVKTDDGYFLTMFRIAPSMSPGSKRPPVLLMHGLLGSADDWLIGRERSLAYMLAKAGHEVWLGSARGSKYARRHVAKHPAQPDFWQFSNDEVALLDLPAMIDYALNVSKQEKMIYVGYSQASADFFALASKRPEFNDKFIAMYALSPMVYMSKTRSPLVKMVAPSGEYFNYLKDQLRDGQFYLNSAWLRRAGSGICEKIIGSKMVCSKTRFIMSGVNMKQMDADMAAVVMSYSEEGFASARQVLQVGQAVDSQEFRMYDHGTVMNNQVYGAPQPPRYELSRVTVPVTVYYGAEDWMVSGEDVRRLQGALPRAAAHALPGFTSLDMLFGGMAPALLYQPLVDSIPKTTTN